MSEPSVSLLLPVYNEVDHIDETMRSLLAQDYGDIVEILVADGGSDDGTIERITGLAAEHQSIVVFHNPDQRQWSGINRAAQRAQGVYLVRIDGHSSYATDYVSRSVAVAVAADGAAGGPMNPVGETPFERAVAAVMNTRWLMPARFHHAAQREEVDTVYLGTFLREAFLDIGGVRGFRSGAAEDADFYYRWRRSGRSVFVDPAIKSSYRPRGTLGGLWRQYLGYGAGKTEMWRVNGELPSMRPLAPLALVIGLPLSVGVGIATGWYAGPTLVWLGWIIALAGSAPSVRAVPRFTLVAGAMQVAYGIGMVLGAFRRGSPEQIATARHPA